MNKLYLFTILILGTSINTLSQEKGFTGGFQVKTMLGNGVFSNDPIQNPSDSLNITINQSFGYVFGMTFRKQFNKTLAVESGLRFVQRNYSTSIDSTYSDYQGKIDYRIIGYEIPLKAMIRLRASEKSYFSVSLGVQMDLYPSDVYSTDNQWQIQVVRKSWLQGSMLANLGWEISPSDVGTFYTGFSFNQPFTDPLGQNTGPYSSKFAVNNTRLSGTYFSLDLRYYFEVKKE